MGLCRMCLKNEVYILSFLNYEARMLARQTDAYFYTSQATNFHFPSNFKKHLIRITRSLLFWFQSCSDFYCHCFVFWKLIYCSYILNQANAFSFKYSAAFTCNQALPYLNLNAKGPWQPTLVGLSMEMLRSWIPLAPLECGRERRCW